MLTKTLEEIRTLHPTPAYILECEENGYTRVLVWATEAEAENDTGANALADYVLAGSDRRAELDDDMDDYPGDYPGVFRRQGVRR